ncbi:MAG: ribosome-associated translation inhibitor RaiA [Nitratireductor sp.]|nr:ribosome-associated translation inhibitor RaiA [Nitratireductor sp.]
MILRISGKHMNVGDALGQRIETRMNELVGKFFEGGYSGSVTLEKSVRGFECDCTLHLDSGMMLQSAAVGHDAAAVFEDAAERIEKRLRRYKRRLKDHHGAARNRPAPEEAAYTVMSAPPEEEEIAADYAPAVIAEMSTGVMTQTVAEAVMQLDLTDSPLVVFTNAANGRTNVVYRRADGNVGWIDPSKN